MYTKKPITLICNLMIKWIHNLDRGSSVDRLRNIGRNNYYRNKISWQFYQFRLNVVQKIDAFGDTVGKQCNAIAAQRLRRTAQIMNLYSKIYNEKTLKTVFDNFRHSVLKQRIQGKPLFVLFSAAIFSWERDNITEDDINGCVEDAEHVHELLKTSGKIATHSGAMSMVACDLPKDTYMDQWENVIDRSHLQIWRRPLDSSYLYEYKVFGTYYDVPARAFYNVQTNLNYRKEWDRFVIQLDVIDRNADTSSDIIHWVTHFPYPMYSRDYVYVRRCHWSERHKVMVVSSRAVEHPIRPCSDQYVRVTRYTSNMVIKPHSSFDENGFDYVLTYHDDPRSNFPTFAYKWMASTGVPDFVDKMHRAAVILHERSKGQRPQSDHVRVKPTAEPITKLPQYS